MHFEIIDCYFNTFYVEMQQKKENLRSFLGTRVWASKLVYQSPKQHEYVNARQNNYSQTTSLMTDTK